MATNPPFEIIADLLKHGDAIPFFGAAASAIYRPEGERWEPGKPFTPFGYELAEKFAAAAEYPVSEQQPPDLSLVASFTEHVRGTRPYIDRKLHEFFSVDCAPGLLHTALGSLDATMLYVTTNYDDLIEKALLNRRPHVVVDRGGEGNLLVRVAGEAEPRWPVKPDGPELHRLLHDLDKDRPSSPIVFKLHGSVDKSGKGKDAYLITEEDYVDFLGRQRDAYILPPYLAGLIERKAFLFLGYSLVDWNVRVILRKILQQHPDRRIWAIVDGHSQAEQELWQARNLKIYPMDLRFFAEKLATELAKNS
jgi:SIR2-like domain